MADSNIRDFIDLNTPTIDSWLQNCGLVKKALKSRVAVEEVLSLVPEGDVVTEELEAAIESINLERVNTLTTDSGEDSNAASDYVLTMEFQDMELKRLLAVKQTYSHGDQEADSAE